MGMFPKKNASRLGTTQSAAFTATSAQVASPFGSQTYQVRVVATSACFIKVGNGTLTATTSDVYLPGGVIDYVIVTPGESIAAIQASAGGTLYVTEMS